MSIIIGLSKVIDGEITFFLRAGCCLSPKTDRWYCYEYMDKTNTPGKRDGRIALWMDGTLIADFPNLRLRDVDDLKIDRFGLGLYIANNTKCVNRKWNDDVVVATSYIGPMYHSK